jgi:hypothetical protein
MIIVIIDQLHTCLNTSAYVLSQYVNLIIRNAAYTDPVCQDIRALLVSWK